MHLSSSLLSGAVFNPGQGAPPPGAIAGDLDTVLSWIAWGVFSIAVVAMLVVAGRMMLSHHRGQGGDHGASLGYVLGGTILAASASAIVGVLT
jgi:hypothetical protein